MSGVPVFIGLGSNLGKSLDILHSAINAMQALSLDADAEIAVSSFYQTQPVGPQDQPDYINAVARFTTTLTAPALLLELQAIEQQHQRKRGVEQWGPRTLDLDILLYGDEVIQSEDLTVPHPRMHERLFVLQPLVDLDGFIEIPGQGKVSDLITTCEDLRIQKVEVNS